MHLQKYILQLLCPRLAFLAWPSRETCSLPNCPPPLPRLSSFSPVVPASVLTSTLTRMPWASRDAVRRYICDGLHDLPPDNWRKKRIWDCLLRAHPADGRGRVPLSLVLAVSDLTLYCLANQTGEERVTVAKQFEMAALSSTGTYERLGQLWMKIAYVYDTIDHRHNHTACNDESAVPAWARDSGLLWRANSSQHSLRDGVSCLLGHRAHVSSASPQL